MWRFIFFFFVAVACANPQICLQRQHFLISADETNFSSVAPSAGAIVPILPLGSRKLPDNKTIYTYAGIYYVPDVVLGHRAYRVIDDPNPPEEIVQSSVPDSPKLVLDGQTYHLIDSETDCKYFLAEANGYRRVSPPAGSFVELLPPGYRSVPNGGRWQVGLVSYIKGKINGRCVYLAVSSWN